MNRTLAVPLVLSLALLALFPGAVGAKERSYNQRYSTFKKALRSKDPKARASAFENLRGTTNPNVAEAIAIGVRTVEKDGDRIRKDQKAEQAKFDKAMTYMHRAQETFNMSAGSSRDMKNFNKKARKISKARDATILRLKNLENEFTRNRAMVQQAVMVLGENLNAMEDDALASALALLTPMWLQSSNPEDRLRWVSSVSEVARPMITDLLHQALESAHQPTLVRVAAIDALAMREDGLVLGKALKMLELPTEQAAFLIAAIGVLRRMHDRRGIVPLITFLERQDIKRTREDAYKALMSLTGQNHGPYPGEWKKWWEEAEELYVMPKNPRPPGNVAQPGKGKTFYGIQTASDRILYIVDISGSMDRQQKGEGAAGKTKWEVLKQELLGSVFNLNPTDTFNVIFFNHQVIPWQPKKVQATERNKKQLKKWVEAQLPVGGTNLSDSLYHGFSIASSGTGRPMLDTLFFLTDGKPTAGRVQDLRQILANFREWNKTAKLTIHTIGVGIEHDVEFMKALARIGDGRYVSTLPVPDMETDQVPDHDGSVLLDFGEVRIGNTVTLALQLGNSGDGVLQVKGFTFKPPEKAIPGADASKNYRMADDTKKPPFQVRKGETVEIKVEYLAKDIGPHRWDLILLSNDGSTPRLTIGLSGVCVP